MMAGLALDTRFQLRFSVVKQVARVGVIGLNWLLGSRNGILCGVGLTEKSCKIVIDNDGIFATSVFMKTRSSRVSWATVKVSFCRAV
jgi:hypothetical protein